MRLGVRVPAQREEVRPLCRRDDDGDMRERLQEPVDDLLMVAGVGEACGRT